MSDNEFVELTGTSSVGLDEALKVALGSIDDKMIQGYEVLETSSSSESADEKSYQVKLKAKLAIPA